jgi:hypothetical protein
VPRTPALSNGTVQLSAIVALEIIRHTDVLQSIRNDRRDARAFAERALRRPMRCDGLWPMTGIKGNQATRQRSTDSVRQSSILPFSSTCLFQKSTLANYHTIRVLVEHHERDHVVAWILRPVQQTTAPFVELLRAIQTTEPAIALRGALRPLLDRCRSAIQATHLASPSTSGIVAITSADRQSPGVIADRTMFETLLLKCRVESVGALLQALLVRSSSGPDLPLIVVCCRGQFPP